MEEPAWAAEAAEVKKLTVAEAAEVKKLTAEVRDFMRRLQDTDSTWSVLEDIESFNDRLHNSFDWIGRMLMFTIQYEVPVDWDSIPTERDDFRGRAMDCLD